jgi:hypothetical protein
MIKLSSYLAAVSCAVMARAVSRYCATLCNEQIYVESESLSFSYSEPSSFVYTRKRNATEYFPNAENSIIRDLPNIQ